MTEIKSFVDGKKITNEKSMFFCLSSGGLFVREFGYVCEDNSNLTSSVMVNQSIMVNLFENEIHLPLKDVRSMFK